MVQKLPALQRLVRQLQKVPFLASKNIYKVAVHFLQQSDAEIEQFYAAIAQARATMRLCVSCFGWAEQEDLCDICKDPKRDGTIVCVLETWHDLFAIEKAGGYRGIYHVLGGALSPLDGIGPDALAIAPLLTRIGNGVIKELIFATNATPEGEATASYIAGQIMAPDVRISRLASGMPIGSSLEHMDRVTIYKALVDRQPF